MKKIKYILKELSGGQELTMKQRGIFMWWSLSLTFAVIFAECLWLCGYSQQIDPLWII